VHALVALDGLVAPVRLEQLLLGDPDQPTVQVQQQAAPLAGWRPRAPVSASSPACRCGTGPRLLTGRRSADPCCVAGCGLVRGGPAALIGRSLLDLLTAVP
jgi:hypothetical protein